MTDLGLDWLALILNLFEIDIFSLSGLENLAFVRTAGATVGT